jgi:hypothetical protein
MPWSVWVVAAALILAMIPETAQVVAFLTIFLGALITALFLNPRHSGSPVSTLANATGLDPVQIGWWLMAMIPFALGLFFLILGMRQGRREQTFLNAGILILGLLLASVIATHRMRPWPI